MMYRVLGLSLCFAMIVAVCGQSDAAFLYGEIEADGNDGFTEQRDANPPVVHPSYDGSGGEGWFMNVGEWFGPGITTAVIPFQLPDFGPVNNPFASASLGLRVFEKGNATVTDLNLYGVRVDSNPQFLIRITTRVQHLIRALHLSKHLSLLLQAQQMVPIQDQIISQV